MERVGALVASVLAELQAAVAPGVATADDSLSAQVEHTVVVRPTGGQVLTAAQ